MSDFQRWWENEKMEEKIFEEYEAWIDEESQFMTYMDFKLFQKEIAKIAWRSAKEENENSTNLRDWIAGMAVGGLLSNGEVEKHNRYLEDIYQININIEEYYPKIAYQIADAMLKERNNE